MMKHVDLIIERLRNSRTHAERVAKRARRYDTRLKAQGRALAYRIAERLVRGAN